MRFTQHIVFYADADDDVRGLIPDASNVTASGLIGGRILSFRDKPGRYVIQADFESAEAAETSNDRPETQEWAERLRAIAQSEINIAIGDKAPEEAPELNLGDMIIEAPGEAAVLVVSPADATVYYYMEGMNAPTGNFRNYGHRPRAVAIADRTLREEEPGVYSAKVKIPAAGTYDVAFLLDTPRMLHCFNVVAKADPELERLRMAYAVEYLLESRFPESRGGLAIVGSPFRQTADYKAKRDVCWV